MFFTLVLLSVHKTESLSFVQPKKTAVEKPSEIKGKIVDKLENILTRTSDLIASIAQEQHLIVEKVTDVARSQGAFAQTNPQKLTRYYQALVTMEQELDKQHLAFQKQFTKLQKDFLER